MRVAYIKEVAGSNPGGGFKKKKRESVERLEREWLWPGAHDYKLTTPKKCQHSFADYRPISSRRKPE